MSATTREVLEEDYTQNQGRTNKRKHCSREDAEDVFSGLHSVCSRSLVSV